MQCLVTIARGGGEGVHFIKLYTTVLLCFEASMLHFK